MTRPPTVFLSSTFYDLRDIRGDVSHFVENELGYRLLASEHSSFPVDPSVDTIENCRRRVESDADIFILIIGGRYGSVPSGLKCSVTNIEYDTARINSLPVFAFVRHEVLALMPVWERNSTADFSAVVDSAELFGFINQVRTTDRVWTFPFERASDVVSTLRTQLAYEVNRGLALSRRLRNAPETAGLTGNALRIVVDRQSGWAPKLLARLVQDEVDRASELRHDHALQIALGPAEYLAEGEVGAWSAALFQQVDRMVGALQTIIGRAMNDASNNKDIAAIRHGARVIGQMYRDCFEWAARLRRAYVPEDRRTVIFEQSFMLDNVITAIEQLGPAIEAETEKAMAEPGEGPAEITVTVQISIANMDRYNAAFAEFRRKRGQ